MKPETAESDFQAILHFVSAMFWPAVVLFAMLSFRTQIISILERFSGLKIGNTEVAFQPPAQDAKPLAPDVKVETKNIGYGGFLTESGIGDLVRESGLIPDDDKIYKLIRIFSTVNQSTWLVFSNNNVLCILDDEGTRRSGKLIQWVMPKFSGMAVYVRQQNEAIGLIDIGSNQNWIYSVSLFPEPDRLKREVEAALAQPA